MFDDTLVNSAKEIFRDFTTDGVPASGRWSPVKRDIREWGTRLENGLPKHFADRGSLYLAPKDPGDSDWLFTDFPEDGEGGHANVVLGIGWNSDVIGPNGEGPRFSRVTSVGANNLQYIFAANRVDAFGSSVMRFTKYGERNTGIGSLVFQWGGARLTDDVTGKFFYHDIVYNAGIPVTEPAWNPSNFETDNPGIRATLAALVTSNPWATSTTDFQRNVGLGRDAGVDIIKGEYNTYGGYRAGAWAFIQSYNTNFGADSGNNNFIGDGNSNFGFEAGYANQQGENNANFGRQAGRYFIKSSRMTSHGFRAAYGVKGGNNSVYIGPYSGAHDANGDHDYRLYIGSSATSGSHQGLIVGDFVNGRIGIGLGLKFADLTSSDIMYLRTNGPVGGAAPNVAARALVIEDGTNDTGITLKTLNTKNAYISFADQDNNNSGHLRYENPNDTFYVRAGASDRFSVSPTSIRSSVPLHVAPGASVTPVNNGEVTFQLTSNTSLTFKAKGSDGTVRSGSISLV